ncbi:unnamed protein product [Aphanomyces euteiches]|uniref:RNA 3'-terminal phosphate cyclase domain-containing protein n=1 Tax=Aphanomyces euteiches TaxID=100861 RepID=A0A6G0XPL7_9STRA|nr:hypothetical protein Ae201684_002642 [Aphanomyces euteiches]KAH9093174.1 hypothetical protein Ae201684P_008833 [Aphanomyces euteiches]KAH9135557.1 hypothetical protein AeRB84_019071 [Aphanomyces euteiches]
MPGDVIDIGVNLLNRQFQKDLPRVLKRSADERVTTIIATGTDIKVSERSVAYIRKRNAPLPRLVCTVGIHPHSAKDAGEDFIAKQSALITKNRDVVVAVGECGLDFNRDFSPRDVQLNVFRQQVQLACDLKMPLFCHERDAHHEFLGVLMPFLETGQLKTSQIVVHCFTGSESELKTYLRLGFYIGLTGFIAMSSRGAALRRCIASIPLGQLMVETDAPFMHPTQSRQRCEPHHIHSVIETIAECMRVPAEEVASATKRNAIRFFNLESPSTPSAISHEPMASPAPQTTTAPTRLVHVDGSKFEGGGQILRLAMPLAAMLKKHVVVHSIRAGRPKPGLGHQHLCGITLLESMSAVWSLEGHHLHSSSVQLIPNNELPWALRGNDFSTSIDTAGAVSLVLQGVLPLLVFAADKEVYQLHLVGGTHSQFAPTVDWIELGLVPLLQKMGIAMDVAMTRRGFMPRGGGQVTVTFPPRQDHRTLLPIVLETPSRQVERVVCRITSGAAATSNAARTSLLKQFRFAFGIDSNVEWSWDLQVDNGLKTPSLSIHVSIELGHGNLLTASVAQTNSTTKAVDSIVADLGRAWDSDGCVDEHLADNALVFMALAAGTSRLRVPKETSSQHIEAAMYVITLVTGVEFTCQTDQKSRLISCVGLGWS